MSSSRALTDADLDALVGKLDLETKVRLLSGAGAWTLEEVAGDRAAHADRVRRPGRRPRRHRHRARALRGPAVGLGHGGDVGRGAAGAHRPAARRRGRAQGRRRRPRPDDQPAPVAAGRPALRVLLRGPAALGPAGHRLRPRCAGAGHRGVPQALRRQRRRDRPVHRRQPGRRADAARALPGPLRGRGRRRRPVDGHGRLQRGQRHSHDRERPARRAAEGRVGLRRRGRLRLGRHLPRRAGRPRRPRPDDARPRAAVARAAGRGRARGPRQRGGDRREGPPDPAAGRPRRRPGRRRAGGGEAGGGPHRGRRTAGSRGRRRGRGPAPQRRDPAAAGRHPAPGRRDRARRQGRPCAGRRVGQRAAAVRGHPVHRPPRRPWTAGPRSSPPWARRCRTRCAAPAPTSCPEPGRARRSCSAGSTATGATVAEQPAGTATIIRLLDTVPDGAAELEVHTGFVPDEDGDWRHRRDRARPLRAHRGRHDRARGDRGAGGLRHPPDVRVAAAALDDGPAGRRSAGRRPHPVPLARRGLHLPRRAASWARPRGRPTRSSPTPSSWPAPATSRSWSSAPARTSRARASTGRRWRCPGGRTSWSAPWRRPTRARSSSSTPARPWSCRGATRCPPSWCPGSRAWSSATRWPTSCWAHVEPGGRLPTTWPDRHWPTRRCSR